MVFGTISNETLALILLGVCVLPIAALIVFAIVKMLLNYKKVNDNAKNGSIDQEQREVFLDAFGGKDNIISVENEMNRVIVEVNDITVVNGEKLQELGATGVLLVGNVVKCGFGDRAKNVYELIK